MLDFDSIHKKSISELFGLLDTSPTGLNDVQVEQLREEYGYNTIPEKKKKPAIIRFSKHLVNLFALLLWAGGILAFIGEMIEPGQGMLFISLALLVVIFLNSLFTYYQESRAEKAMEAFKTLMPPKAKVIRNDSQVEILAREVLPGDILVLSEGDKIAADAILFEVNELHVNHAALTGESEPQSRTLKATHENILESSNVLFSGTIVSAGSGKAIVFATGANTEIGKIAKITLETKRVTTPIHRELQYFIKIITTIAIILGGSFFIIGYLIGDTFWTNLIFAIGIIVANVPEGLLPTVTLALSMASQRMAKHNVLIKSLESVETLGSTTVICTDKTGTLTTGDMRVKSVYFDLNDIPYKNLHAKKDIKAFQHLLQVITLCNNANVTGEDDQLKIVGDPTETALLLFAREFVDIEKLRKKCQRQYEIPFNSKIKKMTTVYRFENESLSFIKGAPETILENCSKVLINDEVVELSHAHRIQIEKQVEAYAYHGQRVLALAYKPVNANDFNATLEKNDYYFIGLISMYDPPRKGVVEAVKKCHQGGIKIIVFSGDHPLTVKAIAQEVGIVADQNAVVITGDEINKMSHQELTAIFKKSDILFARTSPAQKLRIVTDLQQQNEIIAVTGDGVNDAPALKKADIGIAMGIKGTDVAKEAAAMVLVDDNFATIVHAIEQGRTIFDNIKKFIAYILTSNIPEILPFIAFVLLRIPLPMTVILILAVDLGTDLIPALGLGQETPEMDVMQKPPRKRTERLLTRNLLVMSYGIVGMLQAMAGFFAYFYVLLKGGWFWGQQLAYQDPLYQKAITAYFFSIIIVQIADVLICRVRRQSIFTKGVFSNRLVLIGIASELLLGGVIVFAPISHIIFNTHPLTIIELSLALPFALIIFGGDELRKYYLRRENQFVKRYLTW